MFNSPILDLVIFLSFTYFIGSLILSAINEAIAGTLRLRQKDLAKALNKFFFDPQWKNFLKNTLLKSPHIQSLMKAKDRIPAYIPARNFIMALTENINPIAYKNGEFSKTTLAASGLPPEAIKVIETIGKQVSYIEDKTQRIKEFENRLEEFYNNTMDRVTGWYKKRIRRILLIVGIALAVALNIDTLKIANDALKDPDKLSKAADNISANLSKLDSLNGTIKVSDTAVMVTVDNISANTKNLTVQYERTSGFSLGYRNREDFNEQWKSHFWRKLLGILLTAFALQLGANYWFELMTKAVNVRAAGKRPDDKPKETKTS
ncbi:MAG TPA: hypothetical protein VGQ09_17045 [Chitinophagaceae bacterium]|jgi:hypothetical protein|nr:hypothetical protein [Chitinophagaceae bacterium]